MNFTDNEHALTTIKFVNGTNTSIFLTGKAGTGKTTLLKHIVSHTHKQYIIAAPTGIAALHAGGVTLHSLFQIPFGAFIPSNHTHEFTQVHFELTPLSQIMRKVKLNAAKRNLIQQTELLIIDEVSMLRADVLDAIDTVLRSVRRKRDLPFGGVQLLCIGDMLQLPPIVKDDEWNILKSYYKSLYFFDAHVFQNHKPITIELERIYRQSDQEFVCILNNLRNNILVDSDIAILNSYVKQGFEPTSEESYIHITTHNKKADTINTGKLQKIEHPSVFYDAAVKGDFPEHIYPLEYTTELKKDAQIMLVKNDYSGESRYYNGKIGIVHEVLSDEILVRFPDTNEIVAVEKYTWEHKKYTLNQTTGTIEEEVQGTFTHYPIKLAWAVTVHKSQGLTFSRAIIDVSDAFAPGQIYVALSRLESLEGLVLTQPLHYDVPSQNARLLQFTNRKLSDADMDMEYEKGARSYLTSFITNAFDLESLQQEMSYHLASYDKQENRSKKQAYKEDFEKIYAKFSPYVVVANKFQKQLRTISEAHNDYEFLQNRIQAAIEYFEPFFEEISADFYAIITDLQLERGVKGYENELRGLELHTFSLFQKMRKSNTLLQALITNSDIPSDAELPQYIVQKRNLLTAQEPKKKKTGKKSVEQKKELKEKKDGRTTQEKTYELFEQGMSIAQIAEQRELKPQTIESHLAYFVAEGMIDVHEFVDAQTIELVKKKIVQLKTQSLKEIKEELPEHIPYSHIRFVFAHIEAYGGI